MKDKLKAIRKILCAKKWMLITPKDETSFGVTTTFEDNEFTRSGNAVYFKKG